MAGATLQAFDLYAATCPVLRRAERYAIFDMLLGRPAALRPGERWLLEGVSLRVAPGERVGILATSGAEALALGQLLAGVRLPARGRVEASGPVRLFCAPGKGFKSLLSADENLDLALALHGVSPKELAARRAEALALAGLEGRGRSQLHDLGREAARRLGLAALLAAPGELLVLCDLRLPKGDSWRAAFARRLDAASAVVVTTRPDELFFSAQRHFLLHCGRLFPSPDSEAACARWGELLAEACGPGGDAPLAFDEDEDEDEDEDRGEESSTAGGRAGSAGALVGHPRVDGRPTHHREASLLCGDGQRLQVELDYRPRRPARLRELCLRLNPDGVRTPVALARLEGSALLPGGNEEARLLRPDEPVCLAFEFVVPPLARGRFEVCADLFFHDGTRQTLELFALGPRNAAPPGGCLRLVARALSPSSAEAEESA
ncbi:MAG: hypothetical protein D6731_02290 [Planctomycetota bacterium]|nr:MAG: hypothetical protein D6731_02290 [Planctomycetota bacterium]